MSSNLQRMHTSKHQHGNKSIVRVLPDRFLTHTSTRFGTSNCRSVQSVENWNLEAHSWSQIFKRLARHLQVLDGTSCFNRNLSKLRQDTLIIVSYGTLLEAWAKYFNTLQVQNAWLARSLIPS